MRRATVVMLCFVLGATLAQKAAPAATNPEWWFVQRVNEERSSRGLRTLALKSDLSIVAERHSNRMRDAADIWHNPNLANEVSGTWTMLGENVGVGPSIEDLHAALMASTDHRRNILGSGFAEIGVGVVTDPSGEVYVTQIFSDSRTRTSQPSSQPSPKPTSSPKPKPTSSPSPRPPVTSVDPIPVVEPATTTPETSTAPSEAHSGSTPTEPSSASATEDPSVTGRSITLLLRIVNL